MLAAVLLGLAAGASVAAPTAHGVPLPAEGAPKPPALLPGDATASAVGASTANWLVGALPSPRTADLARRFGARRVLDGAPVYRVRYRLARPFAAALKAAGLYGFSEPNRRALEESFPADPLSSQQWDLPAIGATGLTPPTVAANAPVLALIEDGFDASHPEFAGANISGSTTPDAHGTMVTSVAAAPANGRGIVGAFPGARVLISPPGLYCGSAARAIENAVEAGARVINMSYGFRDGCFSHLVATNLAYGRDVTLVAAAGNEGEVGLKTYVSPASDPHIITVAATGPGDQSPTFSNANEAVDLAAPGVGIPVALPVAYDADDGVQDGYTLADGTSFSAPLVAAAATWVATVRNRLDSTQLTGVIRSAARDVGPRGWDPLFGFGAFDLPRALRTPTPVADPLEPNDDIEWVDGRRFRPDPPIHRGRGVTRLRATLDRLEDPLDVYRIVQRPRSSTVIDLRPLFGDPDLEVYAGWAKTAYKRRGRIGGSYRAGRRVDRLIIDNRSRRRLGAWIVAYPGSKKTLDAGYRLTVRRGRLPRKR